MKHLLSSLLVVASMSLAASAFAQSAKVIKVKGQQAIVQFPSGVPPVVGEMIPVGDSAQTAGGVQTARGNRAHSLTLSTDFIMKSVKVDSPSSSTNKTIFDLSGSFGWNQEIFEYGPMGSIYYMNTTGETDRVVMVGGFFDFNFVPNKAGTPMVYGAGANAEFGQNSQTIGSTDTSLTVMQLFLGGNMKLFPFGENVAFRGDAGFNYYRSSGNNSTTQETGILLRGGLAFYF